MIPVLSLFPGADLLGRGFELEGFSVVRGPDILWGQDIRGWSPACHVFKGVIGGSPCQDFSRARRCPPTGEGLELLGEYRRCVVTAEPDWFLLENVPGVPDLIMPEPWKVQRFNLNARECGSRQNRLRCFQFGFKAGWPLVIPRCHPDGAVSRCCMATEGRRTERRTWADFCELQGLPRDFDLPGLTREAKYKAVGNGVTVQMARVVAAAIAHRSVTPVRLCICDCGREVKPGQTMATAACRKRMERKRKALNRDMAGVTVPGPVTPFFPFG